MRTTFETELTLFHAGGGPASSGVGYSVRSLLGYDEFALDLAEALDAVGIPVDQLHPEYGAGQFELSTPPTTPLAAADRVLLFRYVTRVVARRHGLDVSFAPATSVGAVGNGCHLHVSLWRDGVNLMAGGDGPGGLQPEGASLIAGIRDVLPALSAVVTPSVASYLRTRPGHWSGAYTAWESRTARRRSASSRARSRRARPPRTSS